MVWLTNSGRERGAKMDELDARAAASSALGLLHPTLVDVEVVEDTGITVTRSGKYTYDVSFPDAKLQDLTHVDAVEAIVEYILMGESA